jgi:hypothetical protein
MRPAGEGARHIVAIGSANPCPIPVRSAFGRRRGLEASLGRARGRNDDAGPQRTRGARGSCARATEIHPVLPALVAPAVVRPTTRHFALDSFVTTKKHARVSDEDNLFLPEVGGPMPTTLGGEKLSCN